MLNSFLKHINRLANALSACYHHPLCTATDSYLLGFWHVQVMPNGKVTTYKRCDKWSKPKPYATLDRETFSIAPKAS